MPRIDNYKKKKTSASHLQNSEKSDKLTKMKKIDKEGKS